MTAPRFESDSPRAPGVHWWPSGSRPDCTDFVVIGPGGEFLWDTTILNDLVDDQTVAAMLAGYVRLTSRPVSAMRLVRGGVPEVGHVSLPLPPAGGPGGAPSAGPPPRG